MIDYSGQKFNRWTVVKYIETQKYPRFRPGKGQFGYRYKYLVRCECGTEQIMDVSQVRGGHSKSCGCLITPKHTDLKATFLEIKRRCYRVNYKHYPQYGGKGVRLHPHWHYYETFYSDLMQEIGERPMGHTLDRINPSGNYEPGNVKWSTPKQQNNNKRVGNTTEDKATRMISKFFR